MHRQRAVPCNDPAPERYTGQYFLGPYVIPVLSAISALVLIYFLKVGNPLVWGFFPLVWLAFLIWLALGLLFYFPYGRHKSTVALQEAEMAPRAAERELNGAFLRC